MQPGAAAFVERMTVIRAVVARRPRRAVALARAAGRDELAEVWVGAITGNLRSPKFLVRAAARRPERARRSHAASRRSSWTTSMRIGRRTRRSRPGSSARLTGRTYSFTAHAHDIYVERTMLDEKLARRRVRRDDLRLQPAALPRAGTADSPTGSRSSTAAWIRPSSRRATRAAERATTRRERPLEVVDGRHAPAAEGARRARRCGRAPDRAWRAGPCPDRRGRGGARRPRGGHRGGGPRPTGRAPRTAATRSGRGDCCGQADVVVQPSIVLASGKTEGIPVALMEAHGERRARSSPRR